MQLPEKLTEPIMEYRIQGTVNQLIDYLAEREASEQYTNIVKTRHLGQTAVFKAEEIAHVDGTCLIFKSEKQAREALLKLTQYMTLQERLIQDGRKMLGEPAEGYSHYNVDGCTVDQIILHTIEQTIKEGIEVVEGMKSTDVQSSFGDLNRTAEEYNMRDKTLTDTQHALRGIIG